MAGDVAEACAHTVEVVHEELRDRAIERIEFYQHEKLVRCSKCGQHWLTQPGSSTRRRRASRNGASPSVARFLWTRTMWPASRTPWPPGCSCPTVAFIAQRKGAPCAGDGARLGTRWVCRGT